MHLESIKNIQKQGMEALIERLGLYGTARFLEQFEIGHGDYTKEKYEIHKGKTVESIAEEIYEMRKRKGEKS